MPDLGENLRTAIVASTAITAAMPGVAAPYAVQQDVLAVSPPLPRIWYSRNGLNEDLDFDGDGGLVESTWDLEVASDSLSEAQSIAAAVRGYLHGLRGALGAQSVLGITVEDQADDYYPRSAAPDDGLSVSALRVTIWST